MIFPLLSSFVLSAASAQDDPFIVGEPFRWDQNVTVSSRYPDGGERWFLLNLPKDEARGGMMRPGLINIHGFTDTAQGFGQSTGLGKTGPENGIVVAHPQGYDNSWNAGTCCGTA